MIDGGDGCGVVTNGGDGCDKVTDGGDGCDKVTDCGDGCDKVPNGGDGCGVLTDGGDGCDDPPSCNNSFLTGFADLSNMSEVVLHHKGKLFNIGVSLIYN